MITQSQNGDATKRRSDKASIRTRLWSFIVRRCQLVAILISLFTAVAFFATYHWSLELVTHWPVQFAVIGTTACIVLIVARHDKVALLAGVVAAINGAYIAPFYVPKPSTDSTQHTCRIVSANVHTSNYDPARFLDLLSTESPDLVLAMEVNGRWIADLKELRTKYPYRIQHPRDDNFGIALYSRHPFLSQHIESAGDYELPTIVATIELQDGPLTIIGTHPLPPIGKRRAEMRNNQLLKLGDLVSQLPRPIVMLGDLNATSWSPQFKQLIQRSGLRDSRIGFGVQPTWPSKPWLLRIPIDHALVSEDLTVVDRYVGSDIGSDHLPIVVSISRQTDD